MSLTRTLNGRLFSVRNGSDGKAPYDYKNGIELLENTAVENGTALQMPAWGVKIVEEA